MMADDGSRASGSPPAGAGRSDATPDPMGTVGERCQIVITGSSVGTFIRPLRTSVEERTYGEVLEIELAAAGVRAQVTNSSRWSMLLPEALARLEDLVLCHQPDVVVVNFGLVDAQPRTVPLRWFRWMFARSSVQSRSRRAGRRAFGPWAARWYRHAGPRLARIGWFPPRVAAEQFRRDLAMLVDLVRHERSALVVLLGITPASPRVEAVLPGTTARAERYDDVLRAAADGIDVRFLAVDDLGLPLERLAPDGIHFSPAGHRAVGLALAEVVAGWWHEVTLSGLRPLASRPGG
jgi:lysophospholipase L1-like esterase